MFQSVLNTLFGCTHQRTTFPLTPGRSKAALSGARKNTYVVCLDCGKEFAYNWDTMRVGQPVAQRAPSAEVQPSFR